MMKNKYHSLSFFAGNRWRLCVHRRSGHVGVPVGVHGAGRTGRAARDRPAAATAGGGRVDGPQDGGGRAVVPRRGRERAVCQRRDGAARGRACRRRRAGGPAVGRGRVRGRARRRGRPAAAGRGRVHVGPRRCRHHAPGARGPHGQGGGAARRGHGRVHVGVRRHAQHDHRGVRVAAARGRPAPAVPHDGRHTVVGPVPDHRAAPRRHRAGPRDRGRRRARRRHDTVPGPAAPAARQRTSDPERHHRGAPPWAPTDRDDDDDDDDVRATFRVGPPHTTRVDLTV